MAECQRKVILDTVVYPVDVTGTFSGRAGVVVHSRRATAIGVASSVLGISIRIVIVYINVC